MRELSHEKRKLSKRWVIHRIPCYDRLRENVFQGVMYEKYCNGSKAGMATEIIEQVLAAWSEGKETEVV